MKTIRSFSMLALVSALACAAFAPIAQAADKSVEAKAWQEDFGIANCKMTSTGRNDYFVLEPGHQLVLEHGKVRLQITVLDETKVVDGITTRVVEEREWDQGVIQEVSRNYYAICEQSKDVLHFGEDVEVYKDGKLLKNDGTWQAGSNGHRPGLVIAGQPKLGMKYYQEIAPGVTLNRGEVVSLNATCKTAAGTFKNCLKVRGTSGMDPKKLEYKFYAPQIGLVQDEKMRLVKFGVVKGN
jgi:hypothetical protein